MEPILRYYQFGKVADLELRVNTIEQNGVGGGGIAWKNVEDGEVMKSVEQVLTLVGISASLNLGSTTIYKGDSVARLKPYLSVLALYDNGTSKSVTDYTLSGNLANSTNTIVVSYGGFSKDIVVNAEERTSEPVVTLTGISVSVNIGDNVITKGDDLSSIKQYITVTANYSDGSSNVVTDYELYGNLNENSNSIIVTYEGFTQNIVVNAEDALPEENPMAAYEEDGYLFIDTTKMNTFQLFGVVSSYSTEEYSIYSMTNAKAKNIFEADNDSKLIGVIPKVDASSYASLKSLETSEDIVYAIFGGVINFKVKNSVMPNGFFKFLHERLGRIALKLNEAYVGGTKRIDAQKITSMSIKSSSVGAQYAQFGYSDLPSENLYNHISTLFFNPGTNANLTGSKNRAAMSTTTLSIAFDENTFKEFTLDNVKAYLTKYPLIFY